MYKLLLCSRYLRTRYIALASIVSVTLGVATMIVVNSVMSGFQNEMHKRLHGILSDIVVESHSMEGIADAEILEREIRDILGDDLAGLTSTVHIPAMVSFQLRGQWITRQVSLIGIDDQTYAQVSDFSQYLLHPDNREQLSFLLRESGYDDRLADAGWSYRRVRVNQDRFYQEQLQKLPPASSSPGPPDSDAAFRPLVVRDRSFADRSVGRSLCRGYRSGRPAHLRSAEGAARGSRAGNRHLQYSSSNARWRGGRPVSLPTGRRYQGDVSRRPARLRKPSARI